MRSKTKLPSGWMEMKIGHIASEVNERCNTNGHLPVLSMTKYDGFVPSDEYFGRQVYSRELSNYKVVRRGQFAYATIHLDEGSIDLLTGHEAGLISPMYTVFEPDLSKVDPIFLRYLLKSNELIKRYAQIGQGSVNRRKSISFNILSLLRIRLPHKSAQQLISRALLAIDNAVEATRAVIQQTRQLKTTLLQDLLTNGLPGRHREFKSIRGLGRIPASWVPTQLGDLLAEPIRNGHSPLSPNLSTGHWVTTLSAVSVEGYQRTGVKPAPPNDPGVLASILHLGDILVSRSNTRALVGLAGIYDGTPSPCSYSDLLMRVRPDEHRILKEYVLLCLLSRRGRAYFERTARGTSGSMKKIDRNILESLPIPLPSLVEQREIIQAVDAVSNRLGTTADELRQLQSIKAALSQGLLTGRIPVFMAEKEVE